MMTYVYLLIKNNIVVYIGTTGSLKSRIKSHAKNKDFDYVSYMRFDSSYKALEVEDFLIAYFWPEYNKKSRRKKLLISRLEKQKEIIV